MVITSEWATEEALAGMTLRDTDIQEIAIVHPGEDPHAVLRASVRVSYYAELVKLDGKPAIVYGVAQTDLYGVGAVWMLASDEIHGMERYFIRHCREKVELMNRIFPVLFNYVWRNNEAAIRWLTWCGFEVYEPDHRGMCYFRKGVK